MAALLLAACSGGEEGSRGGPPREGNPAPEYGASTLDGEEVTLASFEGEPVLLNFWATWCTPCRREMPFLQSLHEEYSPEGLQVVGVSVDSRASESQIRSFLDQVGVTYPILHDPEGRGMDVFSVLGLPATYIVGRDGTIRFVRIGPIHESDQEFLDALREAV